MRGHTAIATMFAVTLGLIMIGCGKQQPGTDVSASDLIGHWSATDRPYHWEFGSDGRCEVSAIGTPKTGRYEVDNSVLIVHLDNGTNLKARLQMHGDELESIDGDGGSLEFRKEE